MAIEYWFISPSSCMGVMALLSLFLMVFGIIAIIGTVAFVRLFIHFFLRKNWRQMKIFAEGPHPVHDLRRTGCPYVHGLPRHWCAGKQRGTVGWIVSHQSTGLPYPSLLFYRCWWAVASTRSRRRTTSSQRYSSSSTSFRSSGSFSPSSDRGENDGGKGGIQ